MTEDKALMPAQGYRFDRYELRPAERVLLVDGAPVKCGGRAFDMLVALLERNDRVVSKSELMDLVWPNLIVEENNLQAQIVALRKVMGPAAIATVPGRGYRLTLAVETRGSTAGRCHFRRAPGWRQAVERGAAESTQSAAQCGSVDWPRARTRSTADADRRPPVGHCHRSRRSGQVATRDRGGLVVHRPFVDGVWLVELAALADPALVPTAITTASGIAVAPSENPVTALTRQLGDGKLLIVLDNCEHVVDAVASVLESVLSAAPNAHALVSSQELIGIDGEHVLRLPSLTVTTEPNPTPQAALAGGAVSYSLHGRRPRIQHSALTNVRH